MGTRCALAGHGENAIRAADGHAADKPVYVLYSTDCAWSKRLYDDTRILAGKVQLRWIPVAGGTASGVVAARDGASIAGGAKAALRAWWMRPARSVASSTTKG